MSDEPENKDAASVALMSSATKKDIGEILRDVAEIALDSRFDAGPLKEIPFFSWVAKVRAIGLGIRDRIFLKKIAMFLFEASKVSAEKREAFANRLVAEPDLTQRTGESALLLLDHVSSVNKARLMGYALRRFMQEDIDEVILNRIYAAVEFLPLWRLIDLPEFYFETGLGSLDQSAVAAYQNLGLVEIYYGDKAERLHCDFGTGDSYLMAYHQPFYRQTEIGASVAEVIRDYLGEPE